MDKEGLIISPRYRRCGCVIGLCCVLMSIFLTACVTYALIRYVPYFQQPCSSTPASHKTTALPDGSNNLSAQNFQPFNGATLQSRTSIDPSSKYRNLPSNSFINKSCLREIEDSGNKWILKSQNLTSEYLPDDNKTLHCPVTSLVPHDVLQNALDSYSSIKNICSPEEQFAEGFQMQYLLEPKSAMVHKQQLLNCLTKQHCPKSGKNILLAYRDGHDQIGIAKDIIGSSKPTTIVKAGPTTSYSHTTSTPSSTPVACILNRTLYVTGIGTNNNELWKFATEKDEFTKLADLPSGRIGHCMVCVDNNIYILGGTSKSRDARYYDRYQQSTTPKPNITEPSLRYDINSNKWNEIPSIQHYVQGAVCVSYKHQIYVFGGRAENSMKVKSIQIYDTLTDTSSVSIAQMTMRDLTHSVVWKSKVLFFGHYEEVVYNLDTNTWESMSQSMGIPNFSSIGILGFTVLEGTLYHLSRNHGAYSSAGGRPMYDLTAIPLAATAPVSSLPKVWKVVNKMPNLHMQYVLGMYAYPCRKD